MLQEQLASLQEPTGRVLISTDDPERAVATLDGLVERRDGADLVVRSADPAALNARLVAAGVPVRSLAVQRRSLEEIVLDADGRGLRPVRRARMIAVELFKLVRRLRTWISIGLICALPLVVAIFIAVTHLAPPPGQGSAFLSAVLDEGQLYPAAALALVLPVFLPVAVAVVAGDSIAGEASAGTLRYLLARPVGRTELLVAKLVAVITFAVLAVVAVTVTSYATGVLILGPSRAAAVGTAPGGLAPGSIAPGAGGGPTAGLQPGAAITSLSGTPLTTLELIERVLGAMAFITVSMLGVAAIALFLSTLTDSAIGAALGSLAALVVSEILVTLNAATTVQPYLPTRYWLAWIDFFRQPILWRDIQRGFAIQAVYVVVFLAAAWANFATRDVTS